MAICRIIRQPVFEPEAIERLSAAYEHALQALQLTDRTRPMTELVARKIIAIAQAGETDPGACADVPSKHSELSPETVVPSNSRRLEIAAPRRRSRVRRSTDSTTRQPGQ
jgi:hypothetical protein